MPDSRTIAPKGSRRSAPFKPGTPVFARILCAIDGTRTSEAAVRMAVCLAGNRGRVTLLAVTGERGSGHYRMAAINPTRAKWVLHAAQEVADDAGVRSKAIVDRGIEPTRIILERSHDHDLLVIGAPATSRLSRLVVGGVIEGALDAFATPMLLVRRSFAGSLRGKRIVVASDGSSGSERIVELATAIAQAHEAPITLLHAVDHEAASRLRALEAQARLLEQALPDSSEMVVQAGGASNVIVQEARRIRAALIVTGSRRLRGIRALGSVSRQVAHDAPCSVLLLPPLAPATKSKHGRG
jgi:nucleotide-binding universal stress UspA family protein